MKSRHFKALLSRSTRVVFLKLGSGETQGSANGCPGSRETKMTMDKNHAAKHRLRTQKLHK